LVALPAILIGIGILLLIAAIFRAHRLIGILKDRGPWPSFRNLFIFFLIGYLVYFAYLITGRTFQRDLIVGEVFFLSALFAMLVVRFAYRTIHEVMRLDELEQLANTDELTGLFNRRAIMHILEEEFWKARRFGFPLSVAMVDIDHFKEINDTYGHVAGDVVLQEVARVLQRGLRNIDVVGRYGGEEFLCILTSTAIDGAFVTGERIRGLIDDVRFNVLGPRELIPVPDEESATPDAIPIAVSIGVVTVDDRISNPSEALMTADAALYQAKQAGRNQTVAV
jgi:diguanylate cyclase (GGDEF)-like protein